MLNGVAPLLVVSDMPSYPKSAAQGVAKSASAFYCLTRDFSRDEEFSGGKPVYHSLAKWEPGDSAGIYFTGKDSADLARYVLRDGGDVIFSVQTPQEFEKTLDVLGELPGYGRLIFDVSPIGLCSSHNQPCGWDNPKRIEYAAEISRELRNAYPGKKPVPLLLSGGLTIEENGLTKGPGGILVAPSGRYSLESVIGRYSELGGELPLGSIVGSQIWQDGNAPSNARKWKKQMGRVWEKYLQ